MNVMINGRFTQLTEVNLVTVRESQGKKKKKRPVLVNDRNRNTQLFRV